MNLTKQRVGLLLGPIVFIFIILFFEPEGLSKPGVSILASALWIAIWWITEALPIAVTALLPIVLFPLGGGLTLSVTTASYGHKYIFLFIGGFVLAIAIEKWDLHKRIALNIIKIVGTNMKQIILGFMVATAFLSMWISNTATAVMILPVGLAIVSQLKDNPDTVENENVLFGKMLMLAIAYSASIGGIATLIGTPPNLVLAGVVQEAYGIEISFAQWFVFGFPISIVLLVCCWVYLTRFAFNLKQEAFPGGKREINKQLNLLGKISFEEKLVLGVFIITALAWISRSFLLIKIFPAIDDTIIAISAAIVLFVLPSKKKKVPLLTWMDMIKLPWGVLLLFGGGMALAKGFETSGLASWIGSQMVSLDGVSVFVLILVIVAVVNFLTEITSNLATTAMLLPVLVSLAAAIQIHPYFLLIAATLAASCAFMLPVATPPNAVVFGSGLLKVEDMVRKGIWLNLLSILVVSIAVYFGLPLIWDMNSY